VGRRGGMRQPAVFLAMPADECVPVAYVEESGTQRRDADGKQNTPRCCTDRPPPSLSVARRPTGAISVAAVAGFGLPEVRGPFIIHPRPGVPPGPEARRQRRLWLPRGPGPAPRRPRPYRGRRHRGRARSLT